MERERLIKRLIVAVAALSLAFGAFAISLPQGAQLRLLDDAGNLVGGGKVDDDPKLEFDVLANLSGFGSLVLRLPDGTEETYETLFGENGEILVVVGNDIVPLRDLARDAGLAFDFDIEDRDPASLRADECSRWGDDWLDDCGDWDDDGRDY